MTLTAINHINVYSICKVREYDSPPGDTALWGFKQNHHQMKHSLLEK